MIKDWRNENNLDSGLLYDYHLWNMYCQFMKNSLYSTRFMRQSQFFGSKLLIKMLNVLLK